VDLPTICFLIAGDARHREFRPIENRFWSSDDSYQFFHKIDTRFERFKRIRMVSLSSGVKT
jgi:hypothetical protein